MDFEQRLERAITRGRDRRDQTGRSEAERALNEEELRDLHSRLRLDLSEHIENCLKKLSEHFPGFRYKTIVGEDGWGARIGRDDFHGSSGYSRNAYSRLEMTIRPFSSARIIELAAKATIRNKEAFNRTHFQFLAQADLVSFRELIDLWMLEYAEQYAARNG